MQCRCTVSRLDRVRNETAEVEPLKPSQSGKAMVWTCAEGRGQWIYCRMDVEYGAAMEQVKRRTIGVREKGS